MNTVSTEPAEHAVSRLQAALNRRENALDDAQTKINRLLAKVNAVMALHQPIKRWLPHPEATYSYATEEEAREDADEAAYPDDEESVGLAFFEVCGICKDLTPWPCPTVRALEGTQ